MQHVPGTRDLPHTLSKGASRFVQQRVPQRVSEEIVNLIKITPNKCNGVRSVDFDDRNTRTKRLASNGPKVCIFGGRVPAVIYLVGAKFQYLAGIPVGVVGLVSSVGYLTGPDTREFWQRLQAFVLVSRYLLPVLRLLSMDRA